MDLEFLRLKMYEITSYTIVCVHALKILFFFSCNQFKNSTIIISFLRFQGILFYVRVYFVLHLSKFLSLCHCLIQLKVESFNICSHCKRLAGLPEEVKRELEDSHSR